MVAIKRFTAAEVILIIAALSLAAVNIITALKVQNIEHSVNSAASAQVAKIEVLTEQVAALTKALADAKTTAELLAQQAGPAKRK